MTARLVAGVDIGGSKVLAVVLDTEHRVLGRTRLPTRHGAAGIVRTATLAVREAVAAAGASMADLDVVGVGVPGLVHPVTGAVSHAVNLELGTDPVDLAAHLNERLGVRVVVENDVNAAALGAHELRSAGRGDLALLSIGTGLAAGIVLGGRLHRGARGAAGEIGHVPVDPAGAVCSCGQRGCLETLASGSALVAAWPGGSNGSAARGRGSVWDAAASGAADAVAALDVFAGGLAAAVRLIVLTWDVETVVLAGGVTEVGQPLLVAVRAALVHAQRGSALLEALDLPHRVELLPAGSPVAAIGAALLAGGTRSAASLPRAQEVPS
jgi:glucokinase